MDWKRKIGFKMAALFLGTLLILAMALMASAARTEKKQEETGQETETKENRDAVGEPEVSASAESQLTEDKSETVYVKADASGKAREITVEAALKRGDSNAEILDLTNLTDIRNQKGEEEYRRGAGDIIFWENQGEDIYYKGKSSKTLPVELHIRYFLNGKEVTPEEIAGQSGKVTIRFDYENHSLETVSIADEETETIIPFAAVSAVVLPEEVFTNIEVTHGKLLSMSGQSIAVGYVYPGLADYLKLWEYEPAEETEIPDYMEITADVREFELEFTATVVSSGSLADLETEDLDDIQEWIDSMGELADASTKLVDGTGELLNGVEEFQGYLKEYTDGAGELQDGAKALRDGVGTLNDKKADLAAGAKALEGGLEGLDAALKSMDFTGASGTPDAERQAQFLAALQKKMEEEYPDLYAKLTPEEQAALLGLIQSSAAELLAQEASGMGAAMEELKSSVSQLAQGSRQLSDGIAAFNGGIGQIYDGTVQLYDGTKTLSSAGEELYDGFYEAVEGVRSLKEGMEEFDQEGIQELDNEGL